MIVCTRATTTLCRKCFGPDQVIAVNIDKIVGLTRLDPKLSNPANEVFIVSSDDFRSTKMRDEFLREIESKFKDVIVIFILRKSKEEGIESRGVDKFLVKPTPEKLKETVDQLRSDIVSRQPIVSSEDSVRMSKYVPEEFREEEQVELKEEGTIPETENYTEELNIELPEEPISSVQEEKVGSNLVDRIRQCGEMSDVLALIKECDATTIMRELARDNGSYRILEDKISGIKEKIYTIMSDNSIIKLEDKLEKCRALRYDKSNYRNVSNTVLEQRVEEIIDVIVTRTKELLNSRLKELDEAVKRVNVRSSNETCTRIAGINEKRANIMLELATLDKELQEICYSTDNIAHSTASVLAEEEADLTGSPLLNSQLIAKGKSTIIDSRALEGIVNILSTCGKSTKEFQEASLQLHKMQELIYQILELDKEQIAAQDAVINYLKANKIEDTVVAVSMLKKSLRIFVAEEGCGRTVVPLILSNLKSRQNANVLLMDLTGKSKLIDYGVESIDVHDYMRDRVEKSFCVVSGKVSNEIEALQKLLVTLTKSADYYRVINVVLTTEQVNLFNVISNDILSINYVVSTDRKNLDTMKQFIRETVELENVGKRVIVNKSTGKLKPIIDHLDLMDTLNIQIMSIPYIPQIVEAGLSGIKPYEIDTVCEQFQEVMKYA